MSSKRVFFMMVGLVTVLSVLGIAGVVFSDKLLQKQAAKLVELKLESRLLEEQQAALVQANKDIEKYAELEHIAKAIVPQEKDQARTVREIVQFANASGVKLKAINFPSSSLGQLQPKPAASGDAKDGATATPAAPPISQVKPVPGIPGVYSLEVTVQSLDTNGATYAGFVDFLNRLEQNRRTAQVTNISIKPNPNGGDSLSFNIILNVYIKP